MYDPEKKKKQLEALKRHSELKDAYRRLFNTVDGQRVLDHLTKYCGLDVSSVCFQKPDPYQTFFAEGKRAVGLKINSMIKNSETIE